VILRIYLTQSLSIPSSNSFNFNKLYNTDWNEYSLTNNNWSYDAKTGFSSLPGADYAANSYAELEILNKTFAYDPEYGIFPEPNLSGPIMTFQSREGANPPMLRVVYEDVSPDAPTPKGPISVYKNINTAIHFEWNYNSSVGGTQKKYDLQWSVDQTNWTTVSQTTANNYYDMSAGTLPAGNIYWRVRCYNEYDEVSDYCTSQSFYATGAPEAPTINAVPTDSARPVITWAAFGQQVYQLQILSGSTLIYDSGSQPGINVRQHKVTAFLADGIYTAKLRIKNEYDLWSAWSDTAFTITTVKPGKPTLTAQKSSCGISLSIGFTADYVLIYRDGKCVGKTSDNSYADNAITNGSDHSYIVRAVEVGTDTETYTDSNPITITAEFKGALIAPVSDITNVDQATDFL
jgi:hypothetical protein